MSLSRRTFLDGGLALGVVGINPEKFGAIGNGKADDSQSLRTALAEAKKTGLAVVLEAGRIYHVGELTIPTGVTLIVEPGALLQPTQPGSSLLLEGRIVASGRHRVFADGWEFVRSKKLNEIEDVPIEWFGGRTTVEERPDFADAFDYAIAFCKATRARCILLGNGYYSVSRSIVIDAPIGIRGAGIQSSFLVGMMRGGQAPIVDLRSRQEHVPDVAYRDFSLMAVEPGGCIGLRAAFFVHIKVADVEFRNCSIGMALSDTCYSWRIDACKFLTNGTHLQMGPNSNNILIAQTQFLRGETGVLITGSSNSITIAAETNFELIAGRPIVWQGDGTTLHKLSIIDCRFEKCWGAIGNDDGEAAVKSLTFERNFMENNNGGNEVFFDLAGCESVIIAQSYFERADKALVNAPTTTRQLTVCDNILIRIPAINSASASGGVTAAEGYLRCNAYNCGGVRGSIDGSGG